MREKPPTNTQLLSSIEAGFDRLETTLEVIVRRLQPTIEAVPVESTVDEDPHPQLTIGLEYLGFDEDEHRSELMMFFEENGIVDGSGKTVDPSVWAWCAAYADACRVAAGYSKIGSLAAKNFWRVGGDSDDLLIPAEDIEINDVQPGWFACWRNHVAIVAGRCLKGVSKITSLSDWEELEDNVGDEIMVLGGNQSDEVNISPRHWYDNYSKFLGYRKPVL